MKSILTSLFIIFIGVSSLYSQWFTQYTSNPAQTIMALKFYDNNTGYHSGVLYNGSTMNIYKTTNGGLNYTAQNSFYTAQRFMSIFILHPDTVFICGNYGKILRTFNGGQNWIPYVWSDTTIQFWGLWFVNSTTGFAAGSSGNVIKTTNRGDNWFSLTTNQIAALDGIYFINQTTGFVGGANKFIKTTDQGNTWVEKMGLFTSGFETAGAIYFKDANTGMYSTNAGKIVRTTNGGDNWTYVYEKPGGGAVWGLSFPDSLTGYGCTDVGTVVKTTNGGVNWSVQNTPLTENLYEVSFHSVNTGYICSWSGKILKTTNGGLTYITKVENESPQNYSLSQNYPNPFNPSTKIKFEIPSYIKRETLNDNPPFTKGGLGGLTTLKIYDITGKEIATLVNEQLRPGTYEVTFNRGDLPSGIYFYRLTSGDYQETKKLTILK